MYGRGKGKAAQRIWVSVPPIGYSIVRTAGRKSFELNSKGKLIQKAFYWKAEGLSIEAIKDRLAQKGLKMDSRRVSDCLKNPFYCGLLVHNALEGKVVECIQEKAVSKELFFTGKWYSCFPAAGLWNKARK
ncbi:recombinase family protein [Terrimonas ferruginea]|uniref:recombinase family protein n=1 Tax=Terrimonas ferruginea TaxID=249 RepID=UPI00048CB45B|nr:recombinase family protein [Terrimonas ferruginea]